MITRRQFHSRLIAALAATALPRSSFAATPADLYLNRLTFGATATDRATFTDPLTWLDDQLSRPATDPSLDARLAAARLRITYDAASDENNRSWAAADELRPLKSLTSPPADQLYCIDWDQGMDYAERARPGHEVIAAALIRATHTPAQLREVMTQFWHDHFNVNCQKDEFTAAFFPSHDATLRENAFGNFRHLLGQTARAPAMLYYLNNADSKASPANENYAREILELHTLGAGNYLNDLYDNWHNVPTIDGIAQGYLDLDVYEVARAFTGWSVGDGRYIDEGMNAPKTGTFHYIESWHDPYQKRILGVEFAPNRAPMADGEQVLDILAAHPGTARFICTKLARRLLTDTPDASLIDHLATTFLDAKDAPDQIAQVIRALVTHPSFATTPPRKIRRPFEFLTALYRASGAEITGTNNEQHWQLMRAGWRQHEYGPPTGHPDTLDKWTGASSLNRIVDLALNAHEDWFGVATTAFDAEPGESAAAFATRWAARIAPNATDIAQALDLPDAPATDFPQADREATARAAIAFAALTPEFLLR